MPKNSPKKLSKKQVEEKLEKYVKDELRWVAGIVRYVTRAQKEGDYVIVAGGLLVARTKISKIITASKRLVFGPEKAKR